MTTLQIYVRKNFVSSLMDYLKTHEIDLSLRDNIKTSLPTELLDWVCVNVSYDEYTLIDDLLGGNMSHLKGAPINPPYYETPQDLKMEDTKGFPNS